MGSTRPDPARDCGGESCGLGVCVCVEILGRGYRANNKGWVTKILHSFNITTLISFSVIYYGVEINPTPHTLTLSWSFYLHFGPLTLTKSKHSYILHLMQLPWWQADHDIWKVSTFLWYNKGFECPRCFNHPPSCVHPLTPYHPRPPLSSPITRSL